MEKRLKLVEVYKRLHPQAWIRMFTQDALSRIEGANHWAVGLGPKYAHLYDLGDANVNQTCPCPDFVL